MPQPAPKNLLEGEIVEAIYEGDSRRWAVKLEGGELLVAREPSVQEAGSNLERGAHVWLAWDPARTLAYPR